MRGGGSLEWLRLDLSEFASVRHAASILKEKLPVVDLLVNNAGARFDQHMLNADGIEMSFATNYLGHFLMTGLLSEKLHGAESASVMTVSSRRHYTSPKPEPWVMDAANYDRWAAYSLSKLANASFGIELARRWAGSRVLSNVFDPGIVASSFARNNGIVPWLKHLVSGIRAREMVSSRAAARELLDAVKLCDEQKWSGVYIKEGRVAEASHCAMCPEAASRLWQLSLEMTGMDGRVWGKPAEERSGVRT